MGLTIAERDKLPEEQRQRVIKIQRQRYKRWFVIFAIQIAVIAGIAGIFKLAKAYYPDILDYLSQYLSQHRLSQLGALLIVVAGCLLYLVRQKWRTVYGLLELGFATVYGFFALQKVGGEKGYVETLSIVAAVYLVVRGVDNIVIGWKAQNERIAEYNQRLREFIESGK